MKREPTLNRRHVLRIGGGAALSLLVAACNSGSPPAAPTAASQPTTAAAATSASTSNPTPAVQSASSGSAVSITLGYRSGNAPYFESRSKAFTQANPSITIVQRPIAGSNDAYYPKLTSEFAAGSASDVFWVSTGFGLYAQYASTGQLLGADPFVQSDKIDLGQWFKAAINTLQLDGKLYALPWGMHPDDIGLFYNKEMLEKAGVDAPSVDSETFDSLTEKAVKLTKRTGTHTDVWGIIAKTTPYEGLISVVRSFGGDYMTDDKKQAAMNKPEPLAALQWLYDIRTNQKCNPLLSQTPTSGAEDPFVGGTVAMFTSGVWDMSLTDKIGKKFTLGLSLLPKGPKGVRGSMAHVDTISGYSKGKHPNESFKLVEFLTDLESGVQNALINSFWGARSDVWADPRPKQKYGTMVDTWQKAMENVMPLDEPYNFRLVELNTAMDNTLSQLWNGETTPKDIAPKVQDAMNAILSKPRQA